MDDWVRCRVWVQLRLLYMRPGGNHRSSQGTGHQSGPKLLSSLRQILLWKQTARALYRELSLLWTLTRSLDPLYGNMRCQRLKI